MPQSYYNSPFGNMLISSSETGVSSVNFVIETGANEPVKSTIIKKCIKQLDEYFAGKRQIFDLPLDPSGTDFQKQVWEELKNIPFGKAVSYLHIAKALGDANKIRAVGNANGKNPIAIIVPCHRVIGNDGNLVGYAGGLDKKRKLLQFEGAIGKDLFD